MTVSYGVTLRILLWAIVVACAAILLQGCGGAEASGKNVPGQSTTTAKPGPNQTTPVPISTSTPGPLGHSPFEQYVNKSKDACSPWLTRSTCSDAAYNGLVLYLPGFSACATQVEGIAPLLNEKCLDVVAPNFPGHGIKAMTDCNDPEATCTVRWRDGKTGFDLREVPTHAAQYMEFIQSMNELVESERFFRAKALGKDPKMLTLAVTGLSMGGALAAYAVTTSPGLFTHQLLINPFFGLGDQSFDERARNWAVLRLLEAGADRTVLPELAMASDRLLDDPHARSIEGFINRTFDKTVAWDADCPKIFAGKRRGFCTFQYKHVLASHAVGLHALTKALATDAQDFPVTQIITTERDGITRNGFTYQLAKHIAQGSSLLHPYDGASRVGMCMYRFKKGTDRSKPDQYWSPDNCIPHASLDPEENPDGNRWWEKSLFGRIVQFLTGEGPVPASETWDSTRDQCVGLPLSYKAFWTNKWLNSLVLPAAAPEREWELQPGPLSKAVLHVDFAARIGCKTPLLKRFLQRHVDCSIFDQLLAERVRQEADAVMVTTV